RPRTCVRKPLETSQYGLPTLMFDVCSPAPMARFNSGRLFLTSQKFDVVCPVLVPPCRVRPPWRRLRVTSTPLKTCEASPTVLESVTLLRISPNLVGVTSKSPDTTLPPPPGRAGSSGAVTLKVSYSALETAVLSCTVKPANERRGYGTYTALRRSSGDTRPPPTSGAGAAAAQTPRSPSPTDARPNPSGDSGRTGSSGRSDPSANSTPARRGRRRSDAGPDSRGC